MSVESDAIRDLRLKVSLEAKLHKEVSKLNRVLVTNTIKEYIASGNIYDANNLLIEYRLMLESHYKDVGDIFSAHIRPQLSEDVEITDSEDEAILVALLFLYRVRSEQQSQYITDTNNSNIQDSMTDTLDSVHDPDFVGDVTRADIAFLVGATLVQKLNSRLPGITSLETQAVAEAAKLTEAEVLLGNEPSIISGQTPTVAGGTAIKEWVTMGDEKVRPAHEEADSLAISSNEPYIVGGEKLMYPGDTSLGATVGNVINCRCASVMDVEGIIDFRRESRNVL